MQQGTLLTGLVFALGAAGSASAGPIVYQVTVNTSSISGDAGSLDFNFNPGPLATQFASLEIENFPSDGSLSGDCPCGLGDVTGGPLPTHAVFFDNGGGNNDYFDGFTYGDTLTFDISLSGPALSAPDGMSASGSTFAFSMFSDIGGTLPALTSDTVNGFALTVAVNLNGTTTPLVTSTETNVVALPEPSTFALFGASLFLAAWRRLRRGASSPA
jgi:hypothetical protein